MPCVKLQRVGVDTVDNDLLAPAKNLDLVSSAVWRDVSHLQLLEWPVGAEQQSAFRRQAGAHCTGPDHLLHHALQLIGDGGIQDVDIDSWRVRR